MQTIGVVLLFLVGLGGSEHIYGKKRALTTFSILQRGGRCKEEYEFVTKKSHSPGSSSNFRLHPLIHTLLEFDPAQDIVFCQLSTREKVGGQPGGLELNGDSEAKNLC